MADRRRRKRRKGEVVCDCGAYRFPHRFMGGACNGAGYVFKFFEREIWSGCKGCNLRETRDAEDGSIETVCQAIEGREELRECPGLIDHIRYESVPLYGVNKPPPKRMGWRR